MVVELVPFVGVLDIQFGLTRAELRKILGKEFSSFKKSPSSVSETDAYDSLGIYLFYDADDRLELIELFPPFSISVNGVSIFSTAPEQLKNELANVNIDIVENDVGFDAPVHGFGIYRYEDRVDGVCAYRKGYYDQ